MVSARRNKTNAILHGNVEGNIGRLHEQWLDDAKEWTGHVEGTGEHFVRVVPKD